MEGITSIVDIRTSYVQNQNEESAMLKKALDRGIGMLTIREFIEVTEFKLNEILPAETMWNSFRRKIPIYVTDELIKAFGYKGADTKIPQNSKNGL